MLRCGQRRAGVALGLFDVVATDVCPARREVTLLRAWEEPAKAVPALMRPRWLGPGGGGDGGSLEGD